jgi:hypothetical protein
VNEEIAALVRMERIRRDAQYPVLTLGHLDDLTRIQSEGSIAVGIRLPIKYLELDTQVCSEMFRGLTETRKPLTLDLRRVRDLSLASNLQESTSGVTLQSLLMKDDAFLGLEDNWLIGGVKQLEITARRGWSGDVDVWGIRTFLGDNCKPHDLNITGDVLGGDGAEALLDGVHRLRINLESSGMVVSLSRIR